MNVAQLNLSLYGTRDAAMNWAKTFTDFLVTQGFVTGKASPCNFIHAARDIAMTVHGGDFTCSASEDDLAWAKRTMEGKFEIKSEVPGPGPQHARQIRVLTRVIP